MIRKQEYWIFRKALSKNSAPALIVSTTDRLIAESEFERAAKTWRNFGVEMVEVRYRTIKEA